MAVTSTQVSSTAGIRSYEEYVNETRTTGNKLGQDQFLQLLAAQLQYQDPMEPAKDSDFIAQLAQFSSLQQMQSLNTIMTTYQYFGLAGKFISAEVTLEDGTQGVVYGPVDRVVSKDGETYAQVGEYMIDATKITEVYDQELFDGDNQLLQTANLLGCTIQAKTTDAETGEVTEVSGVVTRVTVEDKKLYAYLDNSDSKVAVSDIVDIQK